MVQDRIVPSCPGTVRGMTRMFLSCAWNASSRMWLVSPAKRLKTKISFSFRVRSRLPTCVTKTGTRGLARLFLPMLAILAWK